MARDPLLTSDDPTPEMRERIEREVLAREAERQRRAAPATKADVERLVDELRRAERTAQRALHAAEWIRGHLCMGRKPLQTEAALIIASALFGGLISSTLVAIMAGVL